MAGPPEGYVEIEPGSFEMGSPETDFEAEDDERPAHRVTLTQGFYMKTTPVTQAEWEAVMGFNPSHFEGTNRPVECVSWYEVIAYCNALSEQEGLSPAYCWCGVKGKPGGDKIDWELKSSGYWEDVIDSKDWELLELQSPEYRGDFEMDLVDWEQESTGYRLPTEAEWEYACRAETTAPCYGELDKIAWYAKNSGWESHPVGEKEPNPWGLYDTLGNVCEWVYDAWMREYTTSSVVDPVYIDPTYAAPVRVYRGGCCSNYAKWTRAATRSWTWPSARRDEIGFRLVRSLSGN